MGMGEFDNRDNGCKHNASQLHAKAHRKRRHPHSRAEIPQRLVKALTTAVAVAGVSRFRKCAPLGDSTSALIKLSQRVGLERSGGGSRNTCSSKDQAVAAPSAQRERRTRDMRPIVELAVRSSNSKGAPSIAPKPPSA
eukprot:scaffold97074_cov28-Tisochrysis_lutea.AAC.4